LADFQIITEDIRTRHSVVQSNVSPFKGEGDFCPVLRRGLTKLYTKFGGGCSEHSS